VLGDAAFAVFKMAAPIQEYYFVTFSHYLPDVDAIEKVQKRATKLVISLRKLSYADHLVYLGLPRAIN